MSTEAAQVADIPDSLAAQADSQVDAPVDDKPIDQPKVDEPKADPLADKARASGWRPKEEFEGDPDEWVDAGEFVRRKPLFDQIHNLKKQAKEAEIRREADQVDLVDESGLEGHEDPNKADPEANPRPSAPVTKKRVPPA